MMQKTVHQLSVIPLNQSVNCGSVRTLLACCALTVFSVSLPINAKPIEQHRREYLQAKKALDKKQMKTFGKIANGLKDYPLYAYLRYEYLRKNLWKIKDVDMIHFFNRYDDLPMTKSLRTSWLKLLIKRRQWQTFLDNYVPQSNDTMKCYQLQARMKTGNEDYLLEDIRSVWLSGKSLPPQCDVAFDLLYKSGQVTNELAWDRFSLAMQNNETGLASFLKKHLNNQHQILAQQWLNVHKNPSKHTHKVTLEDTKISRQIIMHGLLRLARQNADIAQQRLQSLRDNYSFLPGEIGELERYIAIRAAKRKSKLAQQLLDQVDQHHINDEVFHYRLKMALAKRDWSLLRRWTSGEPPEQGLAFRWKYWHARALENTGDTEKAKEIYQELAGERDYYGFLSADKLNVAYDMNHYPLPDNEQELQRIAELPALKRAYELYQLGMSYQARREWYHALKKMTTYQMQMAAKLATKWGWYNRAIFTMARAKAYDDLELRFPVTFDDLLIKYANKRQLDTSWVFGLVRAESAFIEDVKSPAGALGLMQVMPKTGEMTAKSIGMKNFKPYKLKQAEINIPIGTAYMQQMFNHFENNMVLATAAYNAGPHRVKKWRPKSGCVEPDIWIEQIPFTETRKYVSRVLYFANIYDWRLSDSIKPITQRMPLITPKNKASMANLSCTELQISDNRYVN